MVARLTSRIGFAAVAAVPALSPSPAAALSLARRDRAGRGRNLAHLDGVSPRPSHPPRYPAPRWHRQRRLHALSRRLQHRNEYDLRWRRDQILSFAARDPGGLTLGATRGRAEPDLDEPDARHDGEITLIHWRCLSVGGQPSHVCQTAALGKHPVEPASTKVRWLASLSVAVVAECGA